VPTESSRSIVPPTVRIAGSLVVLEGAVAIGFAVYSVARALSGTHDQSVTNGYGLALWLGILFGGVLAAGIALLRGKRWGRAVAVVAQLLLLPVAWSLLTDSHQVVLGIVLAVIVVPALVLLFAPQTTTWLAEEYAPDAGPEADRDDR
jgi:peptidoglycan/LPS O-acetylase OafA/YrhL